MNSLRHSTQNLFARRVAVCAALCLTAATAFAQSAAEPQTREQAIAQAQAEKATRLHPHEFSRLEKAIDWVDAALSREPTVYVYLRPTYEGGGLPLGLGYRHYVSPFNMIDVRGSYSLAGYKRVEAEYLAPRLFERRGTLSVLGGWRDVTKASFWGVGGEATQRSAFGFRQAYASTELSVRPTRGGLFLQAGVEATRWTMTSGTGRLPSIESVYTPQQAPGLESEIDYLHTHLQLALDTRPSPLYARRGGYYGVTVDDYTDPDSEFGFRRVDYEAIQHIPILREAWVLSFRGRLQSADPRDDQQVPFFLMPTLGGGSTLRSFSSHRFRDRHGLLLQAEWRVMVNRYIDLSFFYDTGMVAPTLEAFDRRGLKKDYGIGLRGHGPLSTALRIDVARGHDGWRVVFGNAAAF